MTRPLWLSLFVVACVAPLRTPGTPELRLIVTADGDAVLPLAPPPLGG